MTPTTITVRPHELEPGDIIVDHLGQRVGGFDPPSLLLYDNRWYVWSSLDKLICILPGDAEVEVLRHVGDAGPDYYSQPVTLDLDDDPSKLRPVKLVPAPPDDDSLDWLPPHGIVRSRGLKLVVQ